MAEVDVEEDARTEFAREFRKNLNRSRPPRKQYSTAAQYDTQQSALESSLSVSPSYASFTDVSLDGNPFVSFSQSLSDDGSTDGVTLADLSGRGELIYREIDERKSISRLKNGLKTLVPQPIRASLLPPRSRKDWQKFFCTHLPIVYWLWTYSIHHLLGDVIAGITIGVTHIPQGIIIRLVLNFG